MNIAMKVSGAGEAEHLDSSPEAALPLISIIVPVHNTALYLEECLDSLLNQTYRNLEILLIDNNSKDGSSQICDRYAEQDTRIKVFHLIKSGAGLARNFGLAKAIGEYLCFVDSDDYCHGEMIERLYRTLKETTSDHVFCSYEEIYAQKPPASLLTELMELPSHFLNKEEFLHAVYYTREWFNVKGNRGHVWGRLLTRELAHSATFPENITFAEDEYYISKVGLRSGKIYFLNQDLYFYRMRKSSIIHDRHISADAVYSRRKLYEEHEHLPAVVAQAVREGIVLALVESRVSLYEGWHTMSSIKFLFETAKLVKEDIEREFNPDRGRIKRRLVIYNYLKLLQSHLIIGVIGLWLYSNKIRLDNHRACLQRTAIKRYLFI